jgi:hypothetical protein
VLSVLSVNSVLSIFVCQTNAEAIDLLLLMPCVIFILFNSSLVKPDRALSNRYLGSARAKEELGPNLAKRTLAQLTPCAYPEAG